jgi:copper chaperone CopZ
MGKDYHHGGCMITEKVSNLNLNLLIALVVAIATGSMVSAMPDHAVAGENQSIRGDETRRHALVIGNSRYRFIPTLSNPANDATDMAETLKSMGFTVTLKVDATQRAMETEILKFGRQLRKGGVGLFYFAGHGVQVDGRNYLVPIDADVVSPSDIKYETVDAGRILGKMEDAGNGINIIILDACRNNPFAGNARTINRGLTKMEAPTGSILAYATAPGSVAADGKGRNGLYTSKLLKYMQQEGLSIEDCFKKVRVAVMEVSGKSQVPWESSSLTADFYFVGPRQVNVVEKARRPSESVEMMYWESIKDSKDAAQYQTYIDEFPDGAFAALARLYIEKYGTKEAADMAAPVDAGGGVKPTANHPPPVDHEKLNRKKDIATIQGEEIKLAFLPSLFQKGLTGIAPATHQYGAAMKAIQKHRNVSLVYAYGNDPTADGSRIWRQHLFSDSTIDVGAVRDYCSDMNADVALTMKSSASHGPDAVAETELVLIDLKTGEIIYRKKSSNHVYNLLEEIESAVAQSIETLSKA